MAKIRPSAQANLLRAQGVPALGTITKPSFNPVGYYNPDKEKYMLIWSKYDQTQCVSRYVWDNLPNGLTSILIERMLYARGVLCGFKFAGRVYILPFVVAGDGLNIYGMPTKVKPISYNGRTTRGVNDWFGENFELPIDTLGNEKEDYNAVLLYDNVPDGPNGLAMPKALLNQIIIKEIADTFARININVVVSNKKILLQCKDAKQSEVMRRELEIAFGSDSPFAIVTSPMETANVQSTNDYNADDLFNTIKNYDAIRCFMNGISSKSFGTEKKERLVSGELAGAEEEKQLVLDLGLDLRQQFCDLCNKKFGTNMSVRKRAGEYKEQTNGNGNTLNDELEEL